MVTGVFYELSGIIIVAVVVSGLMTLLRQPLIISYILTGIIVSPYVFGLITSSDSLAIFAHLGSALLLFMVGLNLNPKIVREVGKVSVITGMGQFLFTAVIGISASLILGFDLTTSLYIAVGLTFSSTIIIMKLLSDKGDIETVYGRISIGFLVVQDLIAVFILMILSSTSSGGNLAIMALETGLMGLGLLLSLLLVSVYVIPKIMQLVGRNQEYLLLFSIGWCLGLATLFDMLNFSIEIGALLAGVTLSMSPYHFEISSKMRILRDFFLIMFFIALGSELVVTHIHNYIIPILVFSAIILIGNPIIVMFLMGRLGYTKKNSFFAGLTVAQISEFSLILIALGIKVGHITNEVLSIMTMVGLITIFGCSYLILYANKVYLFLSPYLTIFERIGTKVDEHKHHKHEEYDIVVFGCNRIAYDLIESLKKLKKKFLIVDYNPDTITCIAKEGFACIYGDISDPETLKEIDLTKTKMIISTIHDLDTNLLLIDQVKRANENIIIITTSYNVEDSIKLYEEGANYVIIPHFLGGHKTATMVEDYGFDIEKFLKYKIEHLEYLKKRGKGYSKHFKDNLNHT
ncbi:MAG: cation:proton antiporter [Candidatus Altiarchaeota archaeon]|nr:cation:proton antiporter [Candidatus Altiarchaeota archaeon]